MNLEYNPTWAKNNPETLHLFDLKYNETRRNCEFMTSNVCEYLRVLGAADFFFSF